MINDYHQLANQLFIFSLSFFRSNVNFFVHFFLFFFWIFFCHHFHCFFSNSKQKKERRSKRFLPWLWKTNQLPHSSTTNIKHPLSNHINQKRKTRKEKERKKHTKKDDGLYLFNTSDNVHQHPLFLYLIPFPPLSFPLFHTPKAERKNHEKKQKKKKKKKMKNVSKISCQWKFSNFSTKHRIIRALACSFSTINWLYLSFFCISSFFFFHLIKPGTKGFVPCVEMQWLRMQRICVLIVYVLKLISVTAFRSNL